MMDIVNRKPKVFGVGLIALDIVLGSDTESPAQSWAGGTCGNVLSILAYLGWEAFPIARINNDSASECVRADMRQWGVRLDFSGCEPTSQTPIIIQEIRKNSDGVPAHKFSMSCPHCRQSLPGFKAVTQEAVDIVAPNLPGTSVFFMDRLSRAALDLGAQAEKQGAVIVFEPSGKSDPLLFEEAIRLAHVLKYADQRLDGVSGAMETGANTLLEIQTLGSQGLQYRHKLDGEVSQWKHMGALTAPRLDDTCGSGDWCTSGLIDKLADNGLNGLLIAGEDGVREALLYGQALAAWNCAFEGARGGMYRTTRATFDEQIDGLLKGRPIMPIADVGLSRDSEAACPACLLTISSRPQNNSSTPSPRLR